MYQMVLLAVFFAVAMPIFGFAVPGRRISATADQRRAQRRRAILVDARAVVRAARRGRAVLLFLAGLGALLGFLFWGDVPTLTLLVGSAIVVGSGLYLLWHETGKPKPVAAD